MIFTAYQGSMRMIPVPVPAVVAVSLLNTVVTRMGGSIVAQEGTELNFRLATPRAARVLRGAARVDGASEHASIVTLRLRVGRARLLGATMLRLLALFAAEFLVLLVAPLLSLLAMPAGFVWFAWATWRAAIRLPERLADELDMMVYSACVRGGTTGNPRASAALFPVPGEGRTAQLRALARERVFDRVSADEFDRRKAALLRSRG